MFRPLTVAALILGSALAFEQPQTAAARDRDDYYGRNRDRRDWRERERHERREYRRYHRYQRGYYDRWGYWHSY